MELGVGVYENLISKTIQRRLEELEKEGFYIKKEIIDSADSNTFLSNYLAGIVAKILKELSGKDESNAAIEKQITYINQIFHFIKNKWQINTDGDLLIDQKEFLRGIYKTIGLTEKQIKDRSRIHPISGYRVSNLFTGSNRDLSINEEIKRDIRTSDNIDIMVSFILFTGLRLIIDELESFVKRKGTHLRVITTTYMGNSDPKALKRLFQLKNYGNIEIKVSYNTSQERLHAKAYLFNRNNGLNTAYIGSSNLSKSAFTKGLEWNIRITSIENKHIIEKAQASFDSYWKNENFVSINNQDDINKFHQAIDYERHKINSTPDNSIPIIARFERKTHQIKVLEKLQYERKEIHSFKNLIIAATGTGKTAISAFDYKDFNKEFKKKNKREARLLFVVHREQILKQARFTFQSVLVDSNFGEIWTGNYKPSSEGTVDHLFVTIQTINKNRNFFKILGEKNYYDYIVIDEVHHSAAGSYRALFDWFNPKIFIGLTATPERMDGIAIKPDFNDRFAAEIRLFDALNQQLLCPFQYFCVTDNSVDLSQLTFRGDHYDTTELSDTLCNEKRAQVIDDALNKYLTNPNKVKAICFCANIKHANYMAQMLGKKYKAAVLTSQNKKEEVILLSNFAKGSINYLCVVDIMNEGYDIPEIDTILFLRPTESLTIFLQQLGRGMRTADGKTELTVLDFVAQANVKYDYISRFRTLSGGDVNSTEEGIKKGFVKLPRGCSIEMEKIARERILKTVKNSIFNKKRLTYEIAGFEYNTQKELTLNNFLEHFSLEIGVIYKNNCWSNLKRKAKLLRDEPTEIETEVEKYLYQFLHINDKRFIENVKEVIKQDFSLKLIREMDLLFITTLYYNLFYNSLNNLNKKLGTNYADIHEAIAGLNSSVSLKTELLELLNYLSSHINHIIEPIKIDQNLSLNLYGCYTKDEIDILFQGKIKRGNISGCINDEKRKIQRIFCTINKSDKEFSSETMYEDYAQDAQTFHWQSKNTTRADSEAGRRYSNQKDNGWRFLLFIRETKKDSYKKTNPYYCLGFLKFIDSKGECPMTINWHVEKPIPGIILEKAIAV